MLQIYDFESGLTVNALGHILLLSIETTTSDPSINLYVPDQHWVECCIPIFLYKYSSESF